MIEELFRVTVDVPKHVDMNSKMFDDVFYSAVQGSIESGTQDHDWRYVYAVFSSYYDAHVCEHKLQTAFKHR